MRMYFMMNHKSYKIFIYLLVFLLLLVSPAMGTVGMIWNTNVRGGSASTAYVTSVDINGVGDMVYVGLSNGTIFKYNGEGVKQWGRDLGTGSVTKVMTNQSGYAVVVLTTMTNGTAYYINGVDGSINATVTEPVIGNINNTGISKDGRYFFTSGAYNLSIYHSSGAPYATNKTIDIRNISRLGVAAYDPLNGYLIVANYSNKIFRYSVATYIGWDEMNYIHDTRNQSNIRDDGFVLRKRIASANTSNYTMIFINETFAGATANNCVDYSGNGSIFWFDPTQASTWCKYNFTLRNTVTLDDAINNMDYYPSNLTKVFSIKPENQNISIYYGNATYKYPDYPGLVYT